MIKCAACDLIISPKYEKSWEDLTGSAASPVSIVEHEPGHGEEKFVPDVETWSIFCKYLLEGKTSRTFKQFHQRNKKHLVFCEFCITLINRIYEFEKEISQLYKRIDSMISCMKSKIQVSLDTSQYEETGWDKNMIRSFMLGLKPTAAKVTPNTPIKQKPQESKERKDKPNSNELKNVSVVLTKLEKQCDVNSSRVPTEFPPEDIPSSEAQDPSPLSVEHSSSKVPEQSPEPPTTGVRKSIRLRKPRQQIDNDFVYFAKKTQPPVQVVVDEAEDSKLLESKKRTKMELELEFEEEDEDVDYEYPYPECVQLSPLDDTNLEEEEGDENDDDCKEEDEEEDIYSESSEAGDDKGTDRKQQKSKDRKTRRRRLMINKLDEPDLFEWKGFKFRRLANGKIQCETCPSLLNSQPCLVLHIRKIHLREGVGVFPCKICGKSFDRQEILKAHIPIHSEKQYQCYVCGKLYHQRPNLTHHLKTHTGDFKFQCSISDCGKKFLTRGQLENHTRRHLGVKTFQCEYCSRFFVDRSELNRHLKSHAEQLPFKCNLCNSSFFIKYRLKRHYTNVHKVEPPAVIEKIVDSDLVMPLALVSPSVDPDDETPTTIAATVDVQSSELEEPTAPLLHPAEATIVIEQSSDNSGIITVTTAQAVEPMLIQETIITDEHPVLHEMNPHKELITFQSMLE